MVRVTAVRRSCPGPVRSTPTSRALLSRAQRVGTVRFGAERGLTEMIVPARRLTRTDSNHCQWQYKDSESSDGCYAGGVTRPRRLAFVTVLSLGPAGPLRAERKEPEMRSSLHQVVTPGLPVTVTRACLSGH
jgi:hypothetical protein